jgi:hypothetical protein
MSKWHTKKKVKTEIRAVAKQVERERGGERIEV